MIGLNWVKEICRKGLLGRKVGETQPLKMEDLGHTQGEIKKRKAVVGNEIRDGNLEKLITKFERKIHSNRY